VAQFIDKAKRYSDITELTPEILRLFIEKIVVGEKSQKYSRTAKQDIWIYYRDIGLMDTPVGQPEAREAELEEGEDILTGENRCRRQRRHNSQYRPRSVSKKAGADSRNCRPITGIYTWLTFCPYDTPPKPKALCLRGFSASTTLFALPLNGIIAVSLFSKQAPKWRLGKYLRLSKDDFKRGNAKDKDKEVSDSIENQRKILNEFEQMNENEFEWSEEYKDDGFTGTDADRDDFQRLLSDIRTGKINCVIIKDLSRLSRDYVEAGILIDRLFVQMNVRFISLHERIDSYNDPESVSSMVVPITNVMNDQYCYQTSKKIRQVFDYKKRNGQFIGSYAPYGYIKDPNDKHALLVDHEAAEVVKQIFAMFLNGMAVRAIVNHLNDHGVTSQQVHLAVSYSAIVSQINLAPLKKSQSVRLNELISTKEKELTKIMRYKQALYQDWKDGDITHNDYRHMSEDYERQNEAISAVIANLKAERDELENGIDIENPFLATFRKYENINKLTREILIELVDHIKVYEGGDISIRFKFVDELRRITEYIEVNSHLQVG
jgi:DNA invertase Pin-like site-specific DNA recombinase